MSFLHMRAGIFFVAFVSLGSFTGCSAADDSDGTAEQELPTPRWQLSREAREIGATVRIPYEAAGRWSPSRCGGRLLAGTRSLGDHLKSEFSQVSNVGGYACRANTANRSQMSVHGTGRALDVFIPMRRGRANSDAGDPVANWLVKNAADVGVQLVIWNRSIWQANGRNERNYGGPNPHADHIHVEITSRAARQETPFFNRLEREILSDEEAGITTTEPNVEAGDIPVHTAGGSGVDAGGASAGTDATAPAKPTPEQPEREAAPAAADPPEEVRDYDPALDDDGEPGEHDSLSANSDGGAADSSGGCNVNSGTGTGASSTFGGLLAIALGAVFARRRSWQRKR